MKTMLIPAGICCLLGLNGVGPAAARALTDEDAPLSKVVRYADLDIQNPVGAEALYRRIRLAAADVCPAAPHPGQLVGRNACVKDAIDRAVLSVHSAALSRLRFGTDYRLASK
jgi:UrcA family protein